MKIKLIRGTVIGGKARDVGDVVEVDSVLASMLMNAGKGVPHAEPVAQEDRSVGLTTSNTPALVKRGRKG